MPWLPKTFAQKLPVRQQEDLVAASCAVQFAMRQMPEGMMTEKDWTPEQLNLINDVLQWALGSANETFDSLSAFAKEHLRPDWNSVIKGN